jgi:hypothetical protein
MEINAPYTKYMEINAPYTKYILCMEVMCTYIIQIYDSTHTIYFYHSNTQFEVGRLSLT